MKTLITGLIVSSVALSTPSGATEEPTVSEALKDECLQLWESRMPAGYEAIGYRYALDTKSKRARLVIEGVARASMEIEYPYNYVCTVNNDQSLDRILTYFAIRFDEQARSKRNPRGVFGNPVLPALNEEKK